LLRGLGLTQFADTQCGFKVFTAEAAVAVFERVRVAGFGFDVEALFIAQRRGLRVVEVPVRWVNSADSRVHPLRHGARMVWDAVQVRVRAMVEGYDD
jgi:dolichyl-phosphate beta-glucosyltransferase